MVNWKEHKSGRAIFKDSFTNLPDRIVSNLVLTWYLGSELAIMMLIMMMNKLVRTRTVIGEISGSHGGECEDDCLLECCAV
jgi:hypothetical protein